MNTTTSFIKQFVAQVKGDNVQAKAEQTKRQAVSALKSQISNMKGDLVDKEQAVQDAVEARAFCRINEGETISGTEQRKKYVSNLVDANNNITSAQEELEQHNLTIKFLEAELVKVGKDEE